MTLLDEDRLARMRSNVLAEVDDATTDRRRTLRRRLGAGGVAAVLALGAVSVGVATSLPGDDAADISAVDAGSAIEPDLTRAFDEGGDAMAESAPLEEPGVVAETDGDRDVIVTGSVTMEVDRPDETVGRIATFVEGRGGRVDSRFSADRDEQYASLTVRVPSDQVSATLEELETFGDVVSTSLSNDDVTTVTRDLDARIESLDVSIDRLLDILADADDSDEIIRAETALTERQTERERLASERRQLGEQVSLATITIELLGDADTQTVDPGGFEGGLKDGWNALVDVFNGALRGLGAALPWLGVGAGLYLVFRVGRALLRRSK